MDIARRQTREVSIGRVKIGAQNPIAIQSMLNRPTKNTESVLEQLGALEKAGCEIVRLAFSDLEECKLIGLYKKHTAMPLVADIQYDYKLAISAIENGIDKIRFNPGNIGSQSNVEILADCLKAHNIPVRIGVNGGSAEKEFVDKYGYGALALTESCLKHARVLEKCGFYNIVLSVKSSNPKTTLDANRLLSQKTDYPLHLGVTEAGVYEDSIIKSSAVLGALMLDGIGDTIRVSITGDPVREIEATNELMRNIGLKKNYCEIISCPTCSRCALNLEAMARAVKEKTRNIQKPLKIAVMGCAVNGIGEAKGCDLGIAGGTHKSVIFKDGEIIKTVDNARVLDELLCLIDSI